MTNIAIDIASRPSLNVAGVDLLADLSGALFWEDQNLLVVSDLHLEKGSSFAARGVLLPPYDTAATLARLARLIARYAPRAVLALGDSFHDGGGPARTAGHGHRGHGNCRRAQSPFADRAARSQQPAG